MVIAAVLCIALSRSGKDYAILLTIAACCAGLAAAAQYITPVISFLQTLERAGNLESDILGILLKAVGVSILGEIASLICCDAGSATIGKTIQLVTSVVIFCIALPIFEALLYLIQEILENI